MNKCTALLAMTTVILAGGGLLFSGPHELAAASGAVQTYTVEKAKFSVQLPEGWSDMKDVLGMPVVLVGPQVGDLAVTVSITPSGRNDIELDEANLKETYGDYRAGRIEWMKERSATLISFEKFTTESIGKLKAYVAGVNYEVGGTKFAEKSYYVNCGQELYFIKSLVPSGGNAKDAEKLVRSLSCTANG